jgi:hypothetical protein
MAGRPGDIDGGAQWLKLLSGDIVQTSIPEEIVNLPDPSNLKMAQDTDGLSPVLHLIITRKKILNCVEIKDLPEPEKEKFAGRMMRSIGNQTAEGVAPELQQDWKFIVTSNATGMQDKFVKVDVHKILDLKSGVINGRRVPIQDEDSTVMRVAGACCYFVIRKNLGLIGQPEKMKTIVRSNFGRMTPQQRACLVIGVSMWARNSKVSILGTSKSDQYVATFVVALTSGLLEPLTALSKLIKRDLLKVSDIDAIYPADETFPPIRAGSDAFAICKGFVAQCTCTDLKAKFDAQEQAWVASGALQDFAKKQLEDQ